MIRELQFKPDFGRTVDRFSAWWQGEVVDRPPVSLWASPYRPYRGPHKQHASLRERWMDVEYTVDRAVAQLEQGTWLGDSFPIFWPNLGPSITATLWGAPIEFGESTSWAEPVVHSAAEWDRIAHLEPDFDNEYWRTIERMTDYAIEIAAGRYVVGMTDLHGNYDILASLRNPQDLCVDMLDEPEKVMRAGHQVARGFAQAFDRSWRKVSAAGFGSTCWTPAWHDGPSYVPSSDFWCMVSSQMARDMVLPDILTEMAPLERSVFHLDGPQALRHLDLLLEIPQLNAVQWVHGDGQGNAIGWLDVYKRIRAAGKSVQVIAEDAADALAVLDALGPRGVWLGVGKGFDSVDAAESFLKEVTARSHA